MYKRLLVFFLGIALLAGILYAVGFDDTVGAMLTIPLHYLAFLFALQLLIMILAAFKWRIILRHSKVSFRNVLSSTFVGYLINNVNPVGFAGGEPVKAYILSKKEKVPVENVFASVIVDLFLEVFPIFLLNALAIFLVISEGISLEIALVLGLASVGLLVLFGLSIALVVRKDYSLKAVEFILGILARIPVMRGRVTKIRSEIDGILERFNSAMKKHMLDNQILLYGTTVSFIGWLLRIFRVWVIFLALGIKIPLSTLLIVEAVVIILTFIPISPGALGILDGTMIALFVLLGGPVGVTQVKAAAAAMMDRILFYMFPIVLGVFSAIYLGLDVFTLVEKEITSDKMDMDEVSKVISK